MFKFALISITVVPVLAGMLAARHRNRRTGFLILLGFMTVYCVFYMLTLYYLRVRWVG